MQSGGRNPVNAVRQTVTNPDSRKKGKNNEETYITRPHHPTGHSLLLPHQAGALPERHIYRRQQRLRLHRHRRRQCMGVFRPVNPQRFFRVRHLFGRGNGRSRGRRYHKRRCEINHKKVKKFSKPIDKPRTMRYNIGVKRKNEKQRRRRTS